MNLLILPGNSIDNRAWAHEAEKYLGPLAESCLVQEYIHWQNAKKLIDLDIEVRRAQNQAKVIEPYMVFAKSVGCVLAALGIHLGLLEPRRCIFVGTPLFFIEQHSYDFSTWLKSIDCEILFIQNENDPSASAEELSAYLADNIKYQIRTLPGITHQYNDIQSIKKIIQEI